MNARLIEKATTLKTTKGESQNAFKRTNQAKVSAIRLTHTGSSYAALRAKTKQPGAGLRLKATDFSKPGGRHIPLGHSP